MVDRQVVSLDVSRAMISVIVDWTPYSLDESRRHRFRFKLVPAKELWDGWESDVGAWHFLLGKIVDELHGMHKHYGFLQTTLADAEKTVGEELLVSRSLLVERILDRQKAAIAGEEIPAGDDA